MAGAVPVSPRFQFSSTTGVPLAGGSVDIYLAGTTTRSNTWQDKEQTSLNENPIELDASGSCAIFGDPTKSYKLVVKNSAGVVQSHLGGDNISCAGNTADVAAAAATAAAVYVTAAQTAQAAAETAEDAATLAAATAGVYPNTAASNVPRGLTQASVGAITGGSGGTNGTFALAWSVGNFSINPTGTFTVAGGALTAVTITGPGLYIGASPTVPTPSFAASAGLSGVAAVVLTAQFLVTSGQGYWVQSSDGKSLQRYKNVSGVATSDTPNVLPVPTSDGIVDYKGSRLENAVRSALRNSNGTLKALFHADSDRTYFATDVLSTWTSADDNALSATLYSTLYSGADPRPKVDPRGIYFNSQAGLTVSTTTLADTANFALFHVFDVNFTFTTYATKALADAAIGSHVEGDAIKVTADTNTTYTPDITQVYDIGLSGANLVNGYYVRRNATWTDPALWSIFGFTAGTGWCFATFNKLGQIVVQIYDGTNQVFAATLGLDVLGTPGPQILALYRDATHLRLFLNGKEVHAIKTAINHTTLTTFYINGKARAASALVPVDGVRQYIKALSIVDDITWTGFRKMHDALAEYGGVAPLELPGEMWGLLSSGQSWSTGATGVNDVWTAASGWDGLVDQQKVFESGDPFKLTRGPVPHVYSGRGARTFDNGTDIGPIGLILAGVPPSMGTSVHHPAPDGEAWEFSAGRHLTEYANAPKVDWTFTWAGEGDTTLAQLTSESSPAPLVQALKSKTYASLTYYEELLQGIVYARDFAISRGQKYSVKLWFWQQGHNDRTNANYATDFLTHYDKLNAAIKKITGQSDDVICLMHQVNYSLAGTANSCNSGTGVVDQQILNIIDNRSTRPIYCIGPVYQITNFIHAYRAGYRWIGEMMGKVAKQILFDGVDWQPVRPSAFTLGANYVDIDFYVPSGSLQFATNSNNIATSLTNKGFEFTDTSGGGVTISSVAIQDANTVRINLSGAPAATDVVRYVGANSRYGNLCDSDASTAFYKDQDWSVALVGGSPTFTEGSLYDLKNWCCAFTKTLT